KHEVARLSRRNLERLAEMHGRACIVALLEGDFAEPGDRSGARGIELARLVEVRGGGGELAAGEFLATELDEELGLPRVLHVVFGRRLARKGITKLRRLRRGARFSRNGLARRRGFDSGGLARRRGFDGRGLARRRGFDGRGLARRRRFSRD